jgi:hypothetical protein
LPICDDTYTTADKVCAIGMAEQKTSTRSLQAPILARSSGTEVDSIVVPDEGDALKAASVSRSGQRLNGGDVPYCRNEQQISAILPAEVSRIAERLETRALATSGSDDMKAAASLQPFRDVMLEQEDAVGAVH